MHDMSATDPSGATTIAKEAHYTLRWIEALRHLRLYPSRPTRPGHC